MINHIAFVMDGNRRWARKQGLAVTRGHTHGVDSVKKVIEFCLKKGIKYASLYAFSIENFKRSMVEKNFLFNLIVYEAEKGIDELKKQHVRVRFVGDKSLFPETVKKSCSILEDKTKQFDKLHLNILFCYGGRQEIVASVKKIAQKVQNGELSADNISEHDIAQHTWSGAIPDPDLIVRTGGAQRLSNFLLYQAAYSELLFIDKFWPELHMDDFNQIYDQYQERKRRFGQ